MTCRPEHATKCRRHSSCVYGAALVACAATAALARDFQGTWQGYIHLEQVDRPYRFEIAEDPQGHWAARVIIDNDWGDVWTSDSISVNGGVLKFSIPFLGFSHGSTYEGHLIEDGTAMDGMWTAGMPAPLRMVRATPATLWRETAHQTRFVTVDNNVKLEVLDWGGIGRPVVMLAGASLTAHLFSQFAAHLTPHYHVYGVTRRGCGASTAPAVPVIPASALTLVAPNTYDVRPLPNNPYDANRLGDDIIEVLDALHIQRPVLVGHSIAGEELTSVASRYPDRVAGLIYLDAFAEFAFSDGKRYDALFTNEHPMRITLLPGQTPQSYLDVDSALLLGMHEFRSFPNVPALAIFALPHRISGLTGKALFNFNAGQRRAIDRMNRIRALLPMVRVVDFPNADHMVWESNETDVLREMNAFIRGLPR